MAVQAGLDSLGAVELRNAVMAKFGIAVSATVAFDHPTGAALAAHVSATLAASTEDHFLEVRPHLGLTTLRPVEQLGGTLLLKICTDAWHVMSQADSLALVGAPAAQATVIATVAARYPCQRSSVMAEACSGARRFWDGISAGVNLSRTVPAPRWDVDAFYAPEMTNSKM